MKVPIKPQITYLANFLTEFDCFYMQKAENFEFRVK